jgi:DNA-binding LacI/PurR family transcriptional regulator
MPDEVLARPRATSYDVARLAGVAQSTVSRCFRDDSGISPATRTRVLAVAEQLGYVRNALARSLITRRSNMIGVVVTRYTMRGNPDVLYAIGEQLAAAAKQLLLVTVDGDAATLDTLRGVLEYPIEGLVCCVVVPDDDLRELLARRLPVVFYNREADHLPFDSVAADHFNAAGRVAEALHAAGHRRLLLVGGPAVAPVSRQRVEGFGTRANHLGMPPLGVIETDFSYGAARRQTADWLAANRPPDAIFCSSDQLAFGVMDACRFDRSLSIPGDISVVGFDDVPEAARPVYDLTTVRQDTVAMAHEAVRLLLLRLAEPASPPVHTVLASELQRRGSARLV